MFNLIPQGGGEMPLLIILLWCCSAVLRRAGHLDLVGDNSRNSRFGVIYSRLGRLQARDFRGRAAVLWGNRQQFPAQRE
jgi:hypothetical protein